MKVNRSEIFLPNISIDRSGSPSVASSGKTKPPPKAVIIAEQNEMRIRKKQMDDETEMIETAKDRLKQIPSGNYSDGINFIDECLLKIETSQKRRELLKIKLKQLKKYLRSLRTKSTFTLEEKSQLELAQVEYFAALSEMVNIENIEDPFTEKKKYMEEVVGNSLLDEEEWYRFQMKNINSRLPRREQGIPDIRAKDFIPDKWQLDFLNAVDDEQSIIIVAPTASG